MANWEHCTVLKRAYTATNVTTAKAKFEGVIKAQAPNTGNDTINSFYVEPDAGADADADAPKQVKSLDDIINNLSIPKPSNDELAQLRGNKSGDEQRINIPESAHQYHAIEQARLAYLKVFNGYSPDHSPSQEQQQKIADSKNYLNRFATSKASNNDTNMLLDNIKNASERTEHGFECTIIKASNNQWTVSIPLTGTTHGQRGNSVIAGHLSRKLQRLAVSEGKTIDFTLPNRWMCDEKKMVISRRITQDTIREMLVAPKGVKPAIVEVNNNPYLAANPTVKAAYDELLQASKEQKYTSDGKLQLSDATKKTLNSLTTTYWGGTKLLTGDMQVKSERDQVLDNMINILRNPDSATPVTFHDDQLPTVLDENRHLKSAYEKIFAYKANSDPSITTLPDGQLDFTSDERAALRVAFQGKEENHFIASPELSGKDIAKQVIVEALNGNTTDNPLLYNPYLANHPKIQEAYLKVLEAKEGGRTPELTKAEQKQLNKLFPESSTSSKAKRGLKNLGQVALAKVSQGNRGGHYTPSINPLITENTTVTESPGAGDGLGPGVDPDGGIGFGDATFEAAGFEPDYTSGSPGRDASDFNAEGISMRSGSDASTISSVSSNTAVLQANVAGNMDRLEAADRAAAQRADATAATAAPATTTDYDAISPVAGLGGGNNNSSA